MSVDIGIDLGTASVLVYVKGKGVILKEPSVVAFDRDSNTIKAIGEEARLMLGRTPGNVIAVRPLRQGVISDYTVTETGLVLKSSYFRTLAPGKNALKLCSVNGSTDFTFTVVDTGKPIFSFDSLYKTYIITGDAAVYEMPQAQIASHEYTYTFKGWYKESAATNKIAGTGNTPTLETTTDYTTGGKWTNDGAVTLYAGWTASAGNYSAVTLPTITRTGSTCGWSTSSTATTISYASGASFTPTGNTTLYGVCVNNITLNANGGSGGSSTTTVSYGATTLGTITNPSRANTTGTRTVSGFTLPSGNKADNATVTYPSSGCTSATNCKSTNTTTYTFNGWYKELGTCKGDATFKATYTSTYIDYTVIFKNEDGTVLSTNTYHYGNDVTVPTAPTKAADNTYTYTFTGWDKAVVDCAGDVTYTAAYAATYPIALISVVLVSQFLIILF